ncbi:MAG: hypothetical protein AB7F32_06605 [Victivallaceae bacterium]
MKKLLTLLFAAGFAAQLAAVNVAIIGDRDLADLATARCSRLKNVELLERAEVEAALREIKLSQTGAAELAAKIPHAGLIMVFDRAGRVVIFDARRGVRLADFGYRATLEETAAAAAETLDKLSGRADQLATMPKLGIAMVNDLGVPKRLRTEVEKKLIELERKLAASPKILLLERSNLGAVNVERNLSDVRFPLDPSMSLLRIDVEPGSRSGAVNCAVRVTNLEGKVLAELQEQNLLENPAVPDRLVEAVVKFAVELPAPPHAELSPVTPDRGRDATREPRPQAILFDSEASGKLPQK